MMMRRLPVIFSLWQEFWVVLAAATSAAAARLVADRDSSHAASVPRSPPKRDDTSRFSIQPRFAKSQRHDSKRMIAYRFSGSNTNVYNCCLFPLIISNYSHAIVFQVGPKSSLLMRVASLAYQQGKPCSLLCGVRVCGLEMMCSERRLS